MEFSKTSKEQDFLDKLEKKLSEMSNSFDIVIDHYKPNDVDLIITNKSSNKSLLIETKNFKNYLDIPIGTISQLYSLKINNPNKKILFISFSNINNFAKEKFDEIDISYLSDPTIEQAFEKISEELTSS